MFKLIKKYLYIYLLSIYTILMIFNKPIFKKSIHFIIYFSLNKSLIVEKLFTELSFIETNYCNYL
jgi:hypothetical protein